MPGPDPRKARLMQGPSQGKKSGRPGLGSLNKKEKEDKIIIKVVGEDGETLDQPIFVKEKFSKGGRAGYKMGSKGCGKAKTGKGRAYGKNS